MNTYSGLYQVSAHRKKQKVEKTKKVKKQLFLGGSCNPTTWRKDIAIPLLAAAGIPFFNPQVEDWSARDKELKENGVVGGMTEFEATEKEASELLLFVIDGQTRAIASMIEVTEYVTKGRAVVLVVKNIVDGTEIAGSAITGAELKDLNRARAYLLDVAKRHSTPVFESEEEAVEYCIETLKTK